ncbi:MAG: hypothetical protein Q8922_15585 [Bacteroidota bacterium]|nr:hypothetical protein [Bacteroidota bacterium]MDP4234798.1 hypothetical protein [Bacteroidota bacterium]MDP4244164.1 hypothetical protein [Bacteroidota bacterium]MDP4289336.1 hypothetical protein [Bacteroidota bacterium]
MVNVYSDSTDGKFKNAFRITTFLWGTENACLEFEAEIKKCLSKTYRTIPKHVFHASSVDNWRREIRIYEWFLRKVAYYVLVGNLKVLTYFESKEVRDKHSEVLSKPIERALADPTHVIQNFYQEVSDRDRKIALHRMPAIFYFLLFRERFGGAFEHFNYYPDSSGNVLSWQDEVLPFHGFVARNERPHYESFANSLNSVIEVFEKTDWASLASQNRFPASDVVRFWKLSKRLPYQVVEEFRPTEDSSSHLIQAADVICNLWLNALRRNKGINTDTYRYDSLLKFIDIGTFDRVAQYFDAGKEEITCRPHCDEVVDYFRL